MATCRECKLFDIDAAKDQEIARLTAENERLSRHVVSGVLGNLLTADESATMVDFIKFLRADPEARATLKGPSDVG
jgi:hypothetical protein